jgi:hypothetical protein
MIAGVLQNEVYFKLPDTFPALLSKQQNSTSVH